MAKPKIEIINLRDEKPSHEYDVRIHRNSPLGNPFRMCGESTRDDVCNRYYAHFYHQMESGGTMLAEVTRIQALLNKHGIVRLFCWCAPKRCHGETIRDFLLHD